ncbi:MAG: hypothetical protein E6Y30_00450 [Finegoldia magna]|nr:hypothetical protein [Finegoldia magna]
MKKTLSKFVTIMLTVFLFFNAFSTKASADSGSLWVYNKGIWTVRLDSPDGAKPYYHLHFYKKGKHIYCLRLDNMQPCDGTRKNKDKVYKSVMRDVMKHPKVKKAVSYHTPAINSARVRKIAKPLLVAGDGILVVVSAVNIFTGPIDDIAAWTALSAALGM